MWILLREMKTMTAAALMAAVGGSAWAVDATPYGGMSDDPLFMRQLRSSDVAKFYYAPDKYYRLPRDANGRGIGMDKPEG